MPRITPNLWFYSNAEEAADFYASSSRTHASPGHPLHRGGAATGRDGADVEFELAGERFVAINGGPQFSFDEAVSFEIEWETQEEIDYFWGSSARAARRASAWLKDRYGLSWQVVPTGMAELFADPDPDGPSER